MLATCDDEDVLGGVPFYVMEEAHGSVITSDVPDALDVPEHRRAMGLELVDALAEIHAVDWQAAGLEGFGKPTGYLERQLRRFNGLWEHNKTRELPVVHGGRAVAGRQPARVRALDDRARRLPAGQRDGGRRGPARVVSVFDWELATIGDPLADVGYMTITWAAGRRPRGPGLRRPVGRHPARGLPHARRAGGPLRGAQRALGELAWYQALAIWKAAVFMEGNYKAYAEGRSDDEYLGAVRRGRARAGRAGAQIADTGTR